MNNKEFIEFQNKIYKTTNHELIGMLYQRTEEIRAILSILNKREEEKIHTMTEFKKKQQSFEKYNIKTSRQLVNNFKKFNKRFDDMQVIQKIQKINKKLDDMEVNRMAKKGKPKEEQKPKQ